MTREGDPVRPAAPGAGIADHRSGREAGCLVYPVLSRRSGGLSLGINLFPDAKTCSFDCPYCEVFPFSGVTPFTAAALEAELAGFLDRGYAEAWAPRQIRDLCLSGNGEPSLSPRLGEALRICADARRAWPELLAEAKLVLITNSTGFLNHGLCALLHRAVEEEGLVIWAKLDGGTEEVLRRMSRSAFALRDLLAGIAAFAARSPLVIQTMLCSVNGAAPTEAELSAYADQLARLLDAGAKIREVQLYTQARPAPDGITAALDGQELGRWGGLVRERLAAWAMPVRVFGEARELGGAEGRKR